MHPHSNILRARPLHVQHELFNKLFVYHKFQKSEKPTIRKVAEPLPSVKPIFIGYDLHVNPNGISAIPAFTDNSFRGGVSSDKSKANLKNNRVKGELSKSSKRKLSKSINWLVASASNIKVWSKQQKKHYNFKCAFITLTLPSEQSTITDYQFKKHMLAKFVDWMKKTKAVKNYIWKVELQKNGNIHAHIVINQFIHYNDIRREWLKICEEFGLVDNENWRENLQSIPCTEIKPVKNAKKLSNYVAKYLSKSDEIINDRYISGRLWACNYELSNGNKLVIRADSNDTDMYVEWWNNPRIEKINIEVKQKNNMMKTIGYHAKLNPKLWKEIVCSELREIYYNHLWMIRSHMQSLPISYYQL